MGGGGGGGESGDGVMGRRGRGEEYETAVLRDG